MAGWDRDTLLALIYLWAEENGAATQLRSHLSRIASEEEDFEEDDDAPDA